MLKTALKQFGFNEDDCSVNPFGGGLINSTWLVETNNQKYILQRINHNVFMQPGDIAFNIRLIADHLKEHFPAYLFINPCRSVEGDELVKVWDGYFRLFPFLEGSHTIDVVEKSGQAYEAARQFGRFTKLLSGLDTSLLKITLPDFHDLALRYQQFENALQNGNKERIKESSDQVSFIKDQKHLVAKYEYCKLNFKTRCTHHDTKISNVLFDDTGKGLCVIDLDTVMPGYFISDVGDMMRTYLSPVNEEEKDFFKIEARKIFYDAVVNGYLDEMGAELTELEKKHFHFAGEFMIYMQAIRFLTDHLNDDHYYGAKYEGHNFIRAGNQITLLKRLQEINPG
jgi:Ser/Thr protein kinase RdoA (MazF antagonist)